MNNRVERVAAAILEAARSDLTLDECRILARAAIAADDGVALTSMADPNFDEDGNCINPTMEQFLSSRVRPN